MDVTTPDNDQSLDIDLLVREIEQRRPRWESAGFTVGPLTWQSDGWGSPISTDRPEHDAPLSVGFEVSEGIAGREVRGYIAPQGERGWPREGRVVAWTLGYADLDIVNWATEDVESVAGVNQFRDAMEFGRVLDSWFARVSANDTNAGTDRSV